MKKIVSVLLVVLLASIMLPALSESYAPAVRKTGVVAEDYNGEWVCRYAGSNEGTFDAASHLSDLGMDHLLTLRINDGTVEASGIKEMESNPITFTFADGAMVFSPEEGLVVFTMTLLEDGALTFTFNMVEGAGTLYLFRTDAE